MSFKIDRIENAILYDKDHNPIIVLDDIRAISFEETLDRTLDRTLDSMIFNEDDLKVHMILTFEVTGFYTTVEENK